MTSKEVESKLALFAFIATAMVGCFAVARYVDLSEAGSSPAGYYIFSVTFIVMAIGTGLFIASTAKTMVAKTVGIVGSFSALCLAAVAFA